jgi:hypothetical protein
MELLEPDVSAPSQVELRSLPSTDEDVERAARRSLRAQIARLERDLADAFVTAYPMGGLEHPASSPSAPRLLDLGELERVRDGLAQRLREARVTIAARAEVHSANRLRLERMLLEPARHRFVRISQADIGEPGCGVWQVRPRLGLIGMLMGWWEVKLSSGCPLALGRGCTAAARSQKCQRVGDCHSQFSYCHIAAVRAPRGFCHDSEVTRVAVPVKLYAHRACATC